MDVPEVLSVNDELPVERFVTGPLVEAKGPPGPECPDTENPYDLIFD